MSMSNSRCCSTEHFRYKVTTFFDICKNSD